MADSTVFPTLPEAKLTRDDVIRYLLALKTEGHDIYRDPTNEGVFVFVLDDVHRIRLSASNTKPKCQVQGLRYDFPELGVCNVTSLAQLERAVGSMAQNILGSWPFRPTRGRLSATTQATNYRTISNLIGSSRIAAVFDPYLENRSLTTLVDILSFGDGSIAEGVRLLGSTRTTGSTPPKFTRSGVDAWLHQLGVSGEARAMAPNDQHRRFMLLSGGQSLILGHSLNAIHKNEATHVEQGAEDRLFFDSVWASAAPVP